MQDDLSGLSDEELARIAGVTLQPRQRTSTPSAPRGVRNNNPGNIEDGPFARSLPGYAGSDGRFARFDSPEAGGQAKTQLIGSYVRRGFDTPMEIINRWAPPSDNNPTPQYAAYVAQRAGLGLNDRVTEAHIPAIAQAIAEFENGQTVSTGQQVAPDDDLNGLSDEELMELAGINSEPQEVVIDQGVMNVNGRAVVGGVDRGAWDEYWSSRGQGEQAGYQTALGQERAAAQQMADRGLGVGFSDQFTAPLNDEIAGVAGYLTQGVGNLGRRLTGRDVEVSAMDRARAATQVAREGQQAYAEENPMQAGLGNIIGGFAFAPGRVAGAAGAAANVLRPSARQAYGQAAAIGAGYGAADADGGLSDRLGGAALGGGLGVATAGLIDGATRFLPRGRGVLQPNENRVAEALNREIRSNRFDPDTILASLHGAPEGALPLNVGNGALAGAAEVIAQSPGPGRQVILDALRQQRANSGDRIGRRVQEALGGEGNYFATLDGQIAQRRQAANEVMGQIEGQAFNLTPDAVTALRSELAQRELRNAAQLGLASADPVARNNAANLNRLADTLLDNPAAAQIDVRNAQTVSKALLDASSSAWRAGDGARGQALGGLGRAVRENAAEAVPQYRQWLRQYGDDSSNIEALELGRSVLRNVDDPRPDGVSAEVLRRQVSEMSDTAKDLFRKGVGEAIVARARTSKGGVGAMRDILRSQELGDRLRTAFPDEAAFTRFLNAAEAEAGMADVASGVLGNSRTAFRQGAAERMGAPDYGQAVDSLNNTTLTGLALETGRQGLKAAASKIAKNRSILENDNLNELFARALTDQDLLRQMLQGQRPRRGLFGGRAPAGVAGAIPAAVL